MKLAQNPDDPTEYYCRLNVTGVDVRYEDDFIDDALEPIYSCMSSPLWQLHEVLGDSNKVVHVWFKCKGKTPKLNADFVSGVTWYEKDEP